MIYFHLGVFFRCKMPGPPLTCPNYGLMKCRFPISLMGKSTSTILSLSFPYGLRWFFCSQSSNLGWYTVTLSSKKFWALKFWYGYSISRVFNQSCLLACWTLSSIMMQKLCLAVAPVGLVLQIVPSHGHETPTEVAKNPLYPMSLSALKNLKMGPGEAWDALMTLFINLPSKGRNLEHKFMSLLQNSSPTMGCPSSRRHPTAFLFQISSQQRSRCNVPRAGPTFLLFFLNRQSYKCKYRLLENFQDAFEAGSWWLPKPFKINICLQDHRILVVVHECLREALFPIPFVGYHNLTSWRQRLRIKASTNLRNVSLLQENKKIDRFFMYEAQKAGRLPLHFPLMKFVDWTRLRHCHLRIPEGFPYGTQGCDLGLSVHLQIQTHQFEVQQLCITRMRMRRRIMRRRRRRRIRKTRIVFSLDT